MLARAASPWCHPEELRFCGNGVVGRQKAVAITALLALKKGRLMLVRTFGPS